MTIAFPRSQQHGVNPKASMLYIKIEGVFEHCYHGYEMYVSLDVCVKIVEYAWKESIIAKLYIWWRRHLIFIEKIKENERLRNDTFSFIFSDQHADLYFYLFHTYAYTWLKNFNYSKSYNKTIWKLWKCNEIEMFSLMWVNIYILNFRTVHVV